MDSVFPTALRKLLNVSKKKEITIRRELIVFYSRSSEVFLFLFWFLSQLISTRSSFFSIVFKDPVGCSTSNCYLITSSMLLSFFLFSRTTTLFISSFTLMPSGPYSLLLYFLYLFSSLLIATYVLTKTRFSRFSSIVLCMYCNRICDGDKTNEQTKI